MVPVTSAGSVYYLKASSGPSLAGSAMPKKVYSTAPMSVGRPEVVSDVSVATAGTEPTAFTVQDLPQLPASSRIEHLPEWKLVQYNGGLLRWHEWFGQFRSAIDSDSLLDDVKLTYLKTLVTGKAKTAIAEFAYCGTKYKNALKTLEMNFGQPQAVVSAYLDKLSNFPLLKIQNSESVISSYATISALVGVFRSLHHDQDLSCASLLD